MRILVIGDFHIPDREKEIPYELWQEVQNSKYDLILCTGDLTDPKLLDKLKSLAPVQVVNGNMDYWFGLRDLPSSLNYNLKKCKVGLIHGSGVRPRGNPEQLLKIAHEMKVDILISGHTHAQSIRIYGDVLLLNPGSATGCWGGGPANKIPSYLVLEDLNNEIKITGVLLKAGKIRRQIYLYIVGKRKLE